MIHCFGVSGKQAVPYLDDLANLRCSVFREFPYLYDGDSAAEKEYLLNYTDSYHVFLAIAEHQGKIVGVSTCMAMTEADPAFQQPFEESEFPLEEICYFGESVLVSEFRGQGIGHQFFDLREQWAATRGFGINAFCSVIREPNHAQRPENDRSHDSFWKKRGYLPDERFIAQLGWREIGSKGAEVQHSLIYWIQRNS